MSFRELRNFCEIMRTLGYQRPISMENFRTPNFLLVSDILFWLVQRYEPDCDISDEIEEERDRVEFIKSVVSLFASKARIYLNPKKLYQADGFAVQELLKVATVLYNAVRTKNVEEISATDYSTSKASALKSQRGLAKEITESGAKLFDLLGKEQFLRESREKTLAFLETIGNNKQDYVEKCIGEITEQQSSSIQTMNQMLVNLEQDQKSLEAKIQKKQQELDRAEKRIRSLQNVKPAFMEEYEKLEQELDILYNIYVERFRNLEYLEHELDQYQAKELQRIQESNNQLKELQEKIKAEEQRQMLEQPEEEGQVKQEFGEFDRPNAAAGGKGRSESKKKEPQGGMHPQESEGSEEDISLGSEDEILDEDEDSQAEVQKEGEQEEGESDESDF